MIWQDLVITIGSLCFGIALLPMLAKGASRPPVFSSGLTGFWLLVYVIVFATLGLWFSAITSLINGTLWCIIGIMKWRGWGEEPTVIYKEYDNPVYG